MTKFYYLKLSRTKKIRYLKHKQKNSDYIVFLHGFMSDLEGKKPKTFLNFAKKNKLGFLALEYSGHGKSSGKFTNGNISKWTKETSLLIKKIVIPCQPCFLIKKITNEHIKYYFKKDAKHNIEIFCLFIKPRYGFGSFYKFKS